MPFLMLVLYAGLQSFDASPAGGSPDRRRLALAAAAPFVILPMMKPLIVFVVAIRLMDAFRFFDLVYVLTNGGPGHGDRDDHAVHLPARLSHAGDRPRVGARRDHAG